jgi:hypothetical protein
VIVAEIVVIKCIGFVILLRSLEVGRKGTFIDSVRGETNDSFLPGADVHIP